MPQNHPHLDLTIQSTSGSFSDRWNKNNKAEHVYDEALRKLNLPAGQYLLKRLRDGVILNLGDKLGDLGLVDGDILVLQAAQPQDRLMHPATVREFLTASVAELEARLATSEGPVASIELDLDTPELIIAFDHTEHETQVMASRSRLLGPDGRPLIQQHRVPVLGGTSRVHRRHLRMNLARFDLVPPTAELLDESRQPVPGRQWPTSWLGRGIVQQHPVYQRPFFCRPGLREYHEHQQHEDEPWARWREVLPLHLIVMGLVEDMHERFHGAA